MLSFMPGHSGNVHPVPGMPKGALLSLRMQTRTDFHLVSFAFGAFHRFFNSYNNFEMNSSDIFYT